MKQLTHNRRTFEETLGRLTAAAIEASQQEIALAFDVRFGSPTERLIGELGLYARHLATWTCDEEEFGNVRPLRDLLADAALTISIQAKLGTAAIASVDGRRMAETENTGSVPQGTTSAVPSEASADAPPSAPSLQTPQGGDS